MRPRTTALLLLVGLATQAFADQFEAIDGRAVLALTKAPDARPVSRLTFAEVGARPALLKDTRSTLLFAVTSRGNVARLLVSPELRKPGEGGGPPFPVFVLDRADTFDAADLGARIARGRDVVLFPGFAYDLDTAQVVPEGQGGDLSVTKGGPTLVALPGVTLFAPDRPPTPADPSVPRPTPGRAVVPADFAGRYRLAADGRWAGTLDLKVDADLAVSGRFRSDAQGSSYPVTGGVSADPTTTNRVVLTVKFPRAQGEFDGYLWTEGKGAIAGTFRLLDRTYGFFAVREDVPPATGR